MPIRIALSSFLFFAFLSYPAATSTAEEVLLEDYEGGGAFSPAEWANTFEDADGNANGAHDAGKFAAVQWATKWSGMPSTGPTKDLSRFKTFQVDVMVEKGEPVEEGSNFYFQLLNETSAGYSYWEIFVPQTKVPADGKWYRVKFPLDRMDKGHGDGGDPPEDFTTIMGTTCGMTFDEEADQFKLKRANFDNLTLSDDVVTETKVAPSPKTVNPGK